MSYAYLFKYIIIGDTGMYFVKSIIFLWFICHQFSHYGKVHLLSGFNGIIWTDELLQKHEKTIEKRQLYHQIRIQKCPCLSPLSGLHTYSCGWLLSMFFFLL